MNTRNSAVQSIYSFTRRLVLKMFCTYFGMGGARFSVRDAGVASLDVNSKRGQELGITLDHSTKDPEVDLAQRLVNSKKAASITGLNWLSLQLAA